MLPSVGRGTGTGRHEGARGAVERLIRARSDVLRKPALGKLRMKVPVVVDDNDGGWRPSGAQAAGRAARTRTAGGERDYRRLAEGEQNGRSSGGGGAFVGYSGF